jgi:hypothetical protein
LDGATSGQGCLRSGGCQRSSPSSCRILELLQVPSGVAASPGTRETHQTGWNRPGKLVLVIPVAFFSGI